jgi:hypothetical protein
MQARLYYDIACKSRSGEVQMKNILSREKRVRILIVFFIIGLTLSGLSAIPTQWETQILKQLFGSGTWLASFLPEISGWVDRIHEGVQNSYGQYPFLAYPNDWLAFGHVIIAIAFIGPLRDPVKNIWVVELGMIACILVIPWAIIFSLLRDIPVFWTLIDMSFGILGIFLLWFVRRDILSMKTGLPGS